MSEQFRPSISANGIPSRCRIDLFSDAEMAIYRAMQAVEKAGGSVALTNAICSLQQARDHVADHMEGIGRT